MKSLRKLTIEERINQRITYRDGCWLTDFSCSNGYPRIEINNKMTLVHRLMYELHFGEIPPGMYVLHKCDNRKCSNPDHLFLGTQKDNIDDMMNKGRHVCLKGSKHNKAKLDEGKVLEIKRLLAETNLTQKEIGNSYDVSQTVISSIKRGKIWKHVIYQPTQTTNNITNNITYNAPVTKNITINCSESSCKQLSLFDSDEFK